MIADKARVTQMLADAGREKDPFTFGHALNYGAESGFAHLSQAISAKSGQRVPLVFGFDPAPVLAHAQAAQPGRVLPHRRPLPRNRRPRGNGRPCAASTTRSCSRS